MMGLFDRFKKEVKEVKEESYDYDAPLDKKRKFISQITDEKVLSDIVKYDQNNEICWEALDKIQDNNILAELVTKDFGGEGPYRSFGRFGDDALSLIDDDEILHDIYMKSWTCLSTEVLRKISNEDLLRDIENNAEIQCHKDKARTVLSER
ncbi:MAG: hypothetical protein IJ104_02000 [Methanobrevibacter sp.]|nr:hypothetical protein [Methanobrevibacter sp.]